MRKTRIDKDISFEDRKAVDTDGLRDLLSCGRETAVKIGTDAQARVQIGKRVLWNVDKIQKYLDAISA